jgi:hypothetical protein
MLQLVSLFIRDIYRLILILLLSGYAPLLPRIIQVLATNPSQHASTVEGLKLLPGPFLDFIQTSQPEELIDMLK